MDESRFQELERQRSREEYSRQVADHQPGEPETRKEKLKQSMGEFYNDGKYAFWWELLIGELALIEKYDTFEQVRKRAAQLIADKAEQILTVNGVLEKGGI